MHTLLWTQRHSKFVLFTDLTSLLMANYFFEFVYPVLDPGLPCILCGDFNTVVDPSKDHLGCNPSSPWAYNWSRTLSQLMSTYNLKDIWRVQHPDEQAFTWHRPNHVQASPLDMFWICSFFLSFVLSVNIFPFFRSDHCYVHLNLSLLAGIQRGPGVWKFNCAHLRDSHFILMIVKFWESWQAEKSSSFALSAWWDAGKVRLKQLVRDYSRQQASCFRKHISSLERTLFSLIVRQKQGRMSLSFLVIRRPHWLSYTGRSRGGCRCPS